MTVPPVSQSKHQLSSDVPPTPQEIPVGPVQPAGFQEGRTEGAISPKSASPRIPLRHQGSTLWLKAVMNQ